MKNNLTLQVESYMGSAFIVLMAGFFVGFFFIAVKNFNSDLSVINSTQVSVKSISPVERSLIQNWVKENKIVISDGEGYSYLVKKYPNRPWLK